MWSALALILLLAAGFAAYVRLAPHDSDRWHVDPSDEEDPGNSGIRLVGKDAPRFPGHPRDVLDTFSEIVTAAPRSRLLDGGVEEGMMTFITRTRIMGYPDYLTVKATDEGTETKLSILARSRFGSNDWDTNRERLEYWLGELDRALR